ncbi:MAG TPA: sulfur carrier protein ThiS [Planctomycetaceae bacterium]|nr:sulfur carrier protein ThiS [Planctomycetaceae bacterium]HIQ22686.1 sulfur carrier protein ThiS [Planctomycetota bacterium]
MEITVNGQVRTVSHGSTVADLLAELGLAHKLVAVEVNEQLVPKAQHGERRLAPGDRLEIVTLVGGG